MRPFKAFLATFFLCVACASAQADPLVINSGFGTVTPTNFGTFNYSTTDGTVFSFFTSMDTGQTPVRRCSPPGCPPGSTVDLSFRVTGFDIVSGRAIFNGTLYRIDGVFEINAPTVTLPVDAPVVNFLETITFGGTLFFYDANGNPGTSQPLFSMSLAGTGQVGASFALNSSGNFSPTALVYAAPILTPEPATMLLFGTGLAGVGAIVRKRRAKQP